MNADRGLRNVAVAEAASAADMEDVRALFAEYGRWLGVDLAFQNFSEELESLPGDYAPPAGRLLLARGADGAPAAAVGMRRLGARTCEMKRLRVRPPWRGAGLGRRLAEAVVGAARDAGYARMRLDSLSSLRAATALYRSMGFC